MEKPAKRIRKNIAGLLILFFISSGTMLFAKVSWAYLWGMKFRPSQETLFTEEDNLFFVEIENVSPDNVQIAVNSLPPNVSFVSQKKETVLIPRSELQGGGYSQGTRINLWMRFTKTGNYKIKPIDLTIDGGFYQIPVESVEVYQNPRFIHPEIDVIFQNQKIESSKGTKNKSIKIKSGDHILFTVTARYMESIQNIFWDIPEDSIFKKIKEYEINSSDEEKKFVTQFQSVAIFDWQPLSEGEHSFPKVFITATSYNGSVEDIQCPSFSFFAEKSQNFLTEEKEENPFVYAFYESEKVNSTKKKIEVKPQEVLALFELHKKERHSFIFSHATAERKKMEMSFGLPYDYHEPSILLFYVFCTIAFIFLVLTIIYIIKKNRSVTVILASFFIIGIVCVGVYGVKIKESRGVFTGGEMSPIPEHNMMTSVSIQSGSVVSVIRLAGDWMFVRHNDTYGWIPSDSICLIK